MKNIQSKISFSCSIIALLLGLVVLVSWYIGWKPLIQVSPSFVPMQSNTALGFLLGGTALLFINLSIPSIARICSIILIVFSIATLIEYSFDINIGVDEILIQHYITENSPHPGRMALNTSICFLLAGLSTLLIAIRLNTFIKFLSISIFSSVTLALSIVAFSGYITGIESAYGWGQYSAMAVHTSWGFVAISSGIILFLWLTVKDNKTGFLFFRPFITGTFTITITLFLWKSFNYNEDKHVYIRVENETKNIKNVLERIIDPQIDSLVRMSNRWQISGKPTHDNWKSDASLYHKHNKTFQAIEWADSNYIVRWVEPLKGNEEAVGLDLSFERKRIAALQKAMDSQDVAVSRIVELRQGGKGFLVYVPIGFDKVFDGFIIGVFKIKDILDDVTGNNAAADIYIKIFEGESEVYNNSGTSQMVSTFRYETNINFYGNKWRVVVWPTPELIEIEDSFAAESVLIFGFIFSIVLIFASFITEKEGMRTTELKSINALLNKEIIKRKGVARALHKSASFVNSIITNILDGVITINEKGEILSFNKEAENIFGYSESEVLHNNIRSLMPEPDKGNHDNYLTNYFRTGQPKIIGIGRQVLGLRKNGTTFPMDLAINEMFIEGDRHFTGIVRDITLQKESENKIKENEKQLRVITDSVPVLISYVDANQCFRFNNRAYEDWFGLSRDEICGKHIKELFGDMAYERTKKYIEKALSGELCSHETLMPYKYGPLRYVRAEFIPDIDEQGQCNGFFSCTADVTMQKESEKEIINSREEAVLANKAKSQFLTNMSHDLRTPLNSIIGFSQLLGFDQTKTLTKAQKENIERIEISGKHLLTLINEILDLSRIESGNLSISLENVSIAEIIVEVYAYAQPIAQRYGIELVDETHKDKTVFVIADKTRLKQVLLNLVSNAIKYNSKNGTVTIFMEKINDTNLRINVSDTGPGIPTEHHVALFEPFNRLDADKTNIEGSGIGLSIAKQLTEKMNGNIGLDSVVGKGSNFYIDIPVSRFPEIVSDVNKEKQEEINVDPDKSGAFKYKVLYVEDNAVNLKLVEQVLTNTRKNIELLSTDNAHSGIEITRNKLPDLILMDINLPGMSGLEAFDILSKDKKTSNIPVIAISANARATDIEKAINAGFKAYITKPINIADFLKEVDKFLT